MFEKPLNEFSWWDMRPTKCNKTETKNNEKNESMSIVLEMWWLTFEVADGTLRINFKRDMDVEFLNYHKRM